MTSDMNQSIRIAIRQNPNQEVRMLSFNTFIKDLRTIRTALLMATILFIAGESWAGSAQIVFSSC